MSYIFVVLQKSSNCSIIPANYMYTEIIAAFRSEKDAINFIQKEKNMDIFIPQKEYVIQKTILDPVKEGKNECNKYFLNKK